MESHHDIDNKARDNYDVYQADEHRAQIETRQLAGRADWADSAAALSRSTVSDTSAACRLHCEGRQQVTKHTPQKRPQSTCLRTTVLCTHTHGLSYISRRIAKIAAKLQRIPRALARWTTTPACLGRHTVVHLLWACARHSDGTDSGTQQIDLRPPHVQIQHACSSRSSSRSQYGPLPTSSGPSCRRLPQLSGHLQKNA